MTASSGLTTSGRSPQPQARRRPSGDGALLVRPADRERAKVAEERFSSAENRGVPPPKTCQDRAVRRSRPSGCDSTNRLLYWGAPPCGRLYDGNCPSEFRPADPKGQPRCRCSRKTQIRPHRVPDGIPLTWRRGRAILDSRSPVRVRPARSRGQMGDCLPRDSAGPSSFLSPQSPARIRLPA